MTQLTNVKQQMVETGGKLQGANTPDLEIDDLFDMCTDAIASLEIAMHELNKLDD